MYKLKQCWSSVSSVSNESGESIFSSVSKIIDVSRVSSVSSLRGGASSISNGIFFIQTEWWITFRSDCDICRLVCNIDLWTFKVKTSFPLTLWSKLSKNQILFCEISSKWDQSMPRTRFRILREAAKKSSVTLVGARPAGWVWINYSLLVLSRIPQRAVILSWHTSHQRATSSRPCGAEKWRSTALWHPVTRLDMVHQCVA